MPQQIQPDSKVLDAKKKSQVAMSMSLVEGLFGVTCFGLKNESYFGCSSKKLFRRGTLPHQHGGQNAKVWSLLRD